MSRAIDWELIDYFINKYSEIKNDGISNFMAIVSMLYTIIFILDYYQISSSELGEERLNKIT